jgi:isopenicillin N synthase-like dioxygenase
MSTAEQQGSHATTATIEHGDSAIPLLDVSAWSAPEATADGARESVAQALVEALTTVGFVILTNHGISADLATEEKDASITQQAFVLAKAFFALPTEEKMQCAYQSNAANRGYIAMGLEKFDGVASDRKETFDIGYEYPVENTHEYQNRWPTDRSTSEPFDPVAFRQVMMEYFHQYEQLHLRILQAIARGMGLPHSYFDAFCNGHHHNLRLLHYPSYERSKSSRNDDTSSQRGGIHTDYGTLTLLSQDTVSGLVAQTRDGSWHPVPLIPDAIVVNVGEMLQRWSNDVLRATPHQVLEPFYPNSTGGEVDSDIDDGITVVPERFSIAFFCNANKETMLECLPVCQGPDRPPKYEPINAFEYLTARLASTIPVVAPSAEVEQAPPAFV